MTISKTEPVRIKPSREKKCTLQGHDKKMPTMKELHERKYPFLDLDLPEMLDDLLEKGITQLPDLKRGLKRLDGLLTPNPAVIIGW